MKNAKLSKELVENYKIKHSKIKKRLDEFSAIPKKQYFYELCFCICTPQSKAISALAVQEILELKDFKNRDIDLLPILNNKNHYIRFHNQKAIRLKEMKENYNAIEEVLLSNSSNDKKREWINDNVKGIGMKESAHFLRNIGYKDLGILDRHILKHLVKCGVFKEVPNISSKKNYTSAESKFKEFGKIIGIPIDELDLLFWSQEAGEIVK